MWNINRGEPHYDIMNSTNLLRNEDLLAINISDKQPKNRLRVHNNWVHLLHKT